MLQFHNSQHSSRATLVINEFSVRFGRFSFMFNSCGDVTH